MRTLLIAALAVSTSGLFLYAATGAQEPAQSATKAKASHEKSIAPLVALKPGESKELLLTTPCTVGLTRGGGFSLAEMVEGKPSFKNPTLKGNRLFSKDGLKISVADYPEAIAYAGKTEYAPLRDDGLNVFTVTVTAEDNAQPGVTEMHLLDATCNGHCTTDFRVLVLQP
ncbi:MAG: hypothetical protein U0996_25340 [Planctomycetaceae bacterium]